MEPVILQSPKHTLAVDQEEVQFNCTAGGIPSPTITWIISPPSGSSPEFTNTMMPVDGSETRIVGQLLLMVTPALNQTTIICMAENGVGEAATSDNATLIVSGMM